MQCVAVLQRDAVCRGTLQCARMLQSVAVCCSVLHCDTMCCSSCSVLKYVAVRCRVLQCVAVCCSVLQCAAVCCSVLQCAALYCSVGVYCTVFVSCNVLQCVAVCCSVLQCVAVCCRVLPRLASNIASRRSLLQCVAMQCALQGVSVLQFVVVVKVSVYCSLLLSCSVLHCDAVCCNTNTSHWLQIVSSTNASIFFEKSALGMFTATLTATHMLTYNTRACIPFK